MYSSHKISPEAVPPAGFRYLPGRLDAAEQARLIGEIRAVIGLAPLFVPTMPRSGRAFSVRMSNCGALGWVSDATGGYRYQAHHPATGQAWPAIPEPLLRLWDEVADGAPRPEACLINYYAPGAKMGTHRDADEANRSAPVVSVSLGDEAIFHVGGPSRRDPKHRLVLRSGDVVVLGGAARLAYHGVDRIAPGSSALVEEGGRFNLTLRRVRPS
ncbi:MAG TPA: alpha-ketoglutarate-dependent dioxygenase AlkB [Hyphomicrobiaceae bacterium]|jgi:DNA oxidative demethylase|nr:alpha-ketoglutarate-dependent dioxygenase AlkB [Hyphomicrobiaceae bacterium]